jgi:sulfiredoxin
MMNEVLVRLDEIYVPVKLRKTLDEAEIEKIAESVLAEEAQRPVQVRQGKGRYVLISGLNQLEAVRALGEDTIQALIVQVRRT